MTDRDVPDFQLTSTQQDRAERLLTATQNGEFDFASDVVHCWGAGPPLSVVDTSTSTPKDTTRRRWVATEQIRGGRPTNPEYFDSTKFQTHLQRMLDGTYCPWYDFEKLGMVQLYTHGQRYYVIEGRHRVLAHKAVGIPSTFAYFEEAK